MAGAAHRLANRCARAHPPPPAGADLDRAPPAASILPEKYRDPELSLLACEIKPDRPNQLDFNLD